MYTYLYVLYVYVHKYSNLPAIIIIVGSDVPTVLLAVTDKGVIIDKSVMKLTLALVVVTVNINGHEASLQLMVIV